MFNQLQPMFSVIEACIKIGVTEESWAPKIDNGTFDGFVLEDNDCVAGYCYGDAQTGEYLFWPCSLIMRGLALVEK